MEFKLQDLIDIQHFQTLQDRLNKIYSFPSAIIDNDGNILTATAWQDICTQFHRKNEECKKDCIKSDQYILSHLNEANPAVSYRCPRGLVDTATPIIIDGVHYGNFFTGQFFLEEPDLVFFKKQAKKFGFNEDAYLAAVKKVPIWSQKQLNNYLFFIKGLIVVISESGLKNLKEVENRRLFEASEKRHRSILQSAMDGYCLTDTEGRLIEVNDAYCRMSGYSEDELLTMCIPDLEAVEDPQLVAEHMQKVIFQGSDRFESKHRRKDGTVFEVEISTQFRPEECGQCVVFCRDITDRKQAEKALQESEEKYRSMMEGMKESAYICSSDHVIEYMNSRMISRVGRDGTGEFCYKVIRGRNEPCSECPLDKVLQGEHVEFEFANPRDNRCYSVTNSPIYHSDGKFSKLSIFHDITERKSIEAQLRQARKMESIGTMAGGIAHDFNNMLYMITGNAELAMEAIPEWNPVHNNLKAIKSAGLRAAGIVKQLLHFSRQADHALEPIGAVMVIKDALKFMRATIPTSIEIRQHLPDTEVTIHGDPTQINQVMMNLCINASQAMETTGGILDIAVEKFNFNEVSNNRYPDLTPGEWLKITVSDTGPGIPPEIVEQIFDPYFTTKEVGKGSGMGLAVIHGIVKNHHGIICVDKGQEIGATFTVFFPVIAEKPVTDNNTPDKICRGTGEKILFIDDEPSIVGMAGKMLEHLGYAVEVETRPIDALKLFRSKPDAFDLVITDMTMPDLTGVGLSKKLKEIRPDIPVIISTGYSVLVDEVKAKSLGFDGFTMKPIVIKDIAKIIRDVLDTAKSSAHE